jgi:hypothetical protein
MKITEAGSGRPLRHWMQLPWRIYAQDRNWIPHLKQDVEKVFDPRINKLLQARADRKAGAIRRWVLYDEGGLPCGRIAAFIDPKTAWSDPQQPTGGCGFFECINEQAAADMLFNTARDWLKAQGMEAMDGPVNLGERNMFWGLLIENFTDPSIYGTNYNPPYYVQLFEQYGFKLYFKQHFFRRNALEEVQPIFQRKYRQLKNDPEMRSVRDCVGRMRGADSRSDFRTVLQRRVGGPCEPQADGALEAALKIVKAMKPVMDPRLLIFISHKDRPIAMSISLPELNEIFRHVNGDLNWLGKLKFLWHKWRGTVKTMTGIVFGVAKPWQGKGLEGALIVFAEKTVVAEKLYRDTILTWIGDFNPRMMQVCAENLDAVNYRDAGHLPLPLRPQQDF